MLKKGTTRVAMLIVALLLAHCSFAQTSIFRDDFYYYGPAPAPLGPAWENSPRSGWVMANGHARNYALGADPDGGRLRTTTAYPQT
ncbi:MAG: hypothetical protein ICV83_27090, partial [Cytophagales bacterium]|nr:hypothetical protein [Cytophagales bacterium]